MGQTGASGMSCEDLVEEGLQDRAKLRRHRHDAHRVAFVRGGLRAALSVDTALLESPLASAVGVGLKRLHAETLPA